MKVLIFFFICLFSSQLFSQSSSEKIWLVAITINQYQREDLCPKLKYTSIGAYDFTQLYENRQLLLIEPRILVNHRATRNGIIKNLKDLFVLNPEVGNNDMIILYFSGHGGWAGQDVGIYPYDYSGDVRDMITDNDILEVILKSKAKHKICFIEACRVESDTIVMSMYDPRHLKKFNDSRRNISRGIAYITSAKVGEGSFGLKNEPSGFFTKYLIQGLTSDADYNSNSIITISEIFEYLKKSVSKITNGKQNPQINKGGFDPNMPVIIIPQSEEIEVEALIEKPKEPCEINQVGELCISNKSGENRWIRWNKKVIPLPKGAQECLVNLRVGYISFNVYTYPPGGGYYIPGGKYEYEVKIRACEITNKTIR